MLKILIMFCGLVLIWFGLSVLEELYWRYIKKAKVVRVVVPARVYIRMRVNAKHLGIDLDDYIQKETGKFLQELIIEKRKEKET